MTGAPVTAELLDALRRAGVADVSGSTLTRALYAADASLYRVVPQAVARPRSTEELIGCLETARSLGVPLTMRGAGTSVAGNAVGAGLVVDTSRHLTRVLSVDPETRTAVVQPGVVQASLQVAARPHGLRFGPDPSTHNRCTVGGMIGNNACGARALGWGRTSDNVAGLRVAFGNGQVTELGPDWPGAWAADPARSARGTMRAVAQAVEPHQELIRSRFGHFSRHGSGYALEHLDLEASRGWQPQRFLAGTEGTLAVVLEARLDLVPEPGARVLVVLGYPSIAEAADAVPGVLAGAAAGLIERSIMPAPQATPDRTFDQADPPRLLALEGLDARIVDVVRANGGTVPELPRGGAWLMAEVAADTPAAAEAQARALVATAEAVETRVVTEPREQAVLWRIREDGAGLAGRSLVDAAGHPRPAYSGWEDAAVPPARLGEWLRTFDDLLTGHGLQAVPYGHFGDGCVHARIDFGFADGGGRFREFVTEAARAVAALGGSASGEHGDGRARSELLPYFFTPTELALFAEVKRICDPDNVLNPGVLVDPAPLDADLRPARLTLHPLTPEVHRCTGVGKCLADTGSVMCPSYQATREEKDSTRGRARVLQEALDGSLVRGLDDPAVHEALDLCLACKGCARDCPAGVDMATYKAEVLHTQYAGKVRPRTHLTLGRLPQWARVTPPGLANRLLATGPGARLATRLAGVDPRRTLPPFAPRPLHELAGGWFSARPDGTPDVWVWADTFTDRFTPGPGQAALRLLRDAGLEARVIPADACCGLTLVTTGQLDAARRVMRRTVERLHPYVSSGVPVLGLEPSCTATLRDDLPRLLDSPEARTVGAGVRTLAELLTGPLADRWSPPDLTGTAVLAQPHCHHASVLGWEVDRALLERAGASVTSVGGCCGLAGSFGVEQGHHDVSVAIAEHALLPAVRAAAPGTVVLADGFSCRYQLDDLAGVRALHLAELLAGADL